MLFFVLFVSFAKFSLHRKRKLVKLLESEKETIFFNTLDTVSALFFSYSIVRNEKQLQNFANKKSLDIIAIFFYFTIDCIVYNCHEPLFLLPFDMPIIIRCRQISFEETLYCFLFRAHLFAHGCFLSVFPTKSNLKLLNKCCRIRFGKQWPISIVFNSMFNKWF